MNAIIKIYDALRHSGVSDENARTISEAVGELRRDERIPGLENRMTKLEERMAKVEERLTKLEERLAKVEASVKALQKEMNARFKAIETGLSMHRWALGLVVASNLAILAMLVKLLAA
jgi:predicted  nucleic acid-binding Zn-ribbon protein